MALAALPFVLAAAAAGALATAIYAYSQSPAVKQANANLAKAIGDGINAASEAAGEGIKKAKEAIKGVAQEFSQSQSCSTNACGGDGDNGDDKDKQKDSGKNRRERPDGKFSSEKELQRHFDDHGNDFGAKNPAEYRAQADKFLNTERSPGTLEKIRGNGDIVRFNPKTDEFGVSRPDGTIRTYYKPNPQIHGKPTNLDYFNAQ